ncbi:MAG: SCP2 sterol-binding domain-containing protein [Anaerolineae bacterium]|nr:SCP2 sterol-binding domain-containing protein [Anaerolineae bacterium]
MSVFENSQQFYDTVGELMQRAKSDPVVGPKIAKSGVIIQFKYTDPEAVTTVNAKAKPTQPGAYVDVINGPTDLKPDIEMTMAADTAHMFWQGKVNLVQALAQKKIILKGNQLKVLGLLPAVEPLYKRYPELLKEKGYGKLISK